MISRSKLVVLSGFACAGAFASSTAAVKAGDADCVKARDTHGDFKAILNDYTSGKPQFETVHHTADGNVEVTRWIAGRRQSIRTVAGGVFLKLNRVFVGDRELEFAYSRTIDLKTVLPLRAGSTFHYSLAVTRSDTLTPTFIDMSTTVSAARNASIGGCELSVVDVSVDSKGPNQSALNTTVFAPALAYPVEVKVEGRIGERVTKVETKVRSIEPWSE